MAVVGPKPVGEGRSVPTLESKRRLNVDGDAIIVASAGDISDINQSSNEAKLDGCQCVCLIPRTNASDRGVSGRVFRAAIMVILRLRCNRFRHEILESFRGR